MQTASSAGEDFKRSLLTRLELVPAADYTDAMMLLNSAQGVPAGTLPQVWQGGLLALIRNSLPAMSESTKLIAGCVHAGGTVGIGGEQHAQALIILDR